MAPTETTRPPLGVEYVPVQDQRGFGFPVCSGQARRGSESTDMSDNGCDVSSDVSEEGDKLGDGLGCVSREAAQNAYEHLRWAQTQVFRHREITLDPCLRVALDGAFGYPGDSLRHLERQFELWSGRKKLHSEQHKVWKDSLSEWYRG